MVFSPYKVVFACDFLVFEYMGPDLSLLLIKRGHDPYKGHYAFPGGLLDEGEDLHECALRELYEETQVKVSSALQLHTEGRPDRDPRFRSVTSFYTSFKESVSYKAGDDAASAKLFSLVELAEQKERLAFDHGRLLPHLFQRIHYLTDKGKDLGRLFCLKEPKLAKERFEEAYKIVIRDF